MPPPYSTHVIVNVFRCVAQLVSQNPGLLNWPGVFRLAGSREESEKLLEQVINDNFSVGGGSVLYFRRWPDKQFTSE